MMPPDFSSFALMPIRYAVFFIFDYFIPSPEHNNTHHVRHDTFSLLSSRHADAF